MAETLFIADIHLGADNRLAEALLLEFLRGRASQAEALYILGDLFEVWLGDDLILPEHQAVLEALKVLSDKGVEVKVLHGNRDFLLGEQFTVLSGASLIDETNLIDLYGVATLICHGDLLCSDDHEYQQARKVLRDPKWIANFLSQTPQQRIEFAKQLRAKSRTATVEKSDEIMDTNDATVRALLQSHHAQRLIHGHTHRPAHHSVEMDYGIAERIVLGEWRSEGSLVSCDVDGCRLQSFG